MYGPKQDSEKTNLTLLALKIEGGAVSQRTAAAVKSGESRKTSSPLKPSKGTMPGAWLAQWD